MTMSLPEPAGRVIPLGVSLLFSTDENFSNFCPKVKSPEASVHLGCFFFRRMPKFGVALERMVIGPSALGKATPVKEPAILWKIIYAGNAVVLIVVMS